MTSSWDPSGPLEQQQPSGTERRAEDPRVTAAASGLGPRDRSTGDDGNGPAGGSGGGGGAHRAPKASSPSGAGAATGAGAAGSGGRGLALAIAALVLGLVLGAFGATLLGQSDDDGGGDPFAGVIDGDRFQAVILSNDKVYFGQISDASDDFFELDRAFFLRETRESADAEPVRALLPVNREIHAPDNTMLIRKDEVVLVENLAADSPILEEIERQLGEE
jgi:hypothetical protein